MGPASPSQVSAMSALGSAQPLTPGVRGLPPAAGRDTEASASGQGSLLRTSMAILVALPEWWAMEVTGHQHLG